MPIYEYVCKDCGKKSEILVRANDTALRCECGSTKMEKVFSTFAVSESASSLGGCSDGSCSLANSSPCASGMCGLN